MDALRTARSRRNLSQRELAIRAGLSFRGYQLLESSDHNARIHTLERAAAALELPPDGVRLVVGQFMVLPSECIRAAGIRILTDGADSWTIHLFDFVDAFRRSPGQELIRESPPELQAARLDAIVAGTVEMLCTEAEFPEPAWCATISPLPAPWFVAGIENLKATALVESPLPFRKRNVFVLGNFLDRV